MHADGALSCMRDMGEEMEELRELLKDSQRGSRDEAIRNRYHGDPNPYPNSNPCPNTNPYPNSNPNSNTN